MLVKLFLVWFVVAASIAVAAAVVPSVEIDGGVAALLGIAVVFGLVNALIGPVLRFISIPLTLITFGLFALVVNGALLAITAGFSDSFDVGGIFSTIIAALIISVVSAILSFAVDRVVAAPSSAPHPQS